MLKTVILAVARRLFPKMEEGESGAGHCHEPALDVDSLPQAVREKLTNEKFEEKGKGQ